MNARRLVAGAALALTVSALGPAWGQADVVRPVLTEVSSEGLTAQGHGEVKVAPDIAYVTISVTTQAQDQGDAGRQNAAKTKSVLAALRAAGVADKDVETQSYSVQPQYDYKPSPPVLTGYEVQNSVQATVRDLTKVGPVIDRVTAAGASQIGGVSFDLSDRAGAESAALVQAVTAARRKAGVMASAAGVNLGRLLTVTEGSVPTFQPVRPQFAMRAVAADAPAPQTPIADQQIKVMADATLVYALGLAR